MRKYSIIAAILLIGITANAQSVGINNNSPHASAALDITSTTKGVLIPRLTQAQRLAIASPAKGLLVYDSTSNSFWYRNGAAWQELIPGTNAWKLTGNSGTDTSINFIGTTDAKALVFKVNNQRAGTLDYDVSKGNTGFGYAALASNTLGIWNTASGLNALYSNTTGYYNTANGVYALYANTTGNSNTAIGLEALGFNTTGYYNTASGFTALYSNTTGSYNTANGMQALGENKTGNNNSAYGYDALYYNIAGNNGVAVGDSSQQNVNSTDISWDNTNTSVGHQSLMGSGNAEVNTGVANTAIGREAMLSNSSGSYNTANGMQALSANTTGNQNTANGYQALISNTAGNNNTAFGWEADVTTDALSNATAIGYNAKVNASNKVRIGNSSVTVIEGQVDWSFPSDGRFKTNVTETVKGLDFIMSLRPVVYNFQTKKYDEFVRKEMPDKARFANQQDFSKSESIRHSGFVAQEVEQAAKDAGYDFNGVIVPENDKQTYSLSYAQFVVPLVKAIQEQQQQIEKLKQNNTTLLLQQEKLGHDNLTLQQQNEQSTATNEQLQLQLQNLMATVSTLNKKVEMVAAQSGNTNAVAATAKK